MSRALSLRSSPLRTARLVAGDIKLTHSVFALPFALLGGCMAAAWPTPGTLDPRRFLEQALLVVLAMVMARTVAMLSNRIIDRHIDARNPRTADRALPSGRLGVGAARTVLALGALSFLAVCAVFALRHDNGWPLVLGVPVLAWIGAYAWLKRFTVLCHAHLGASLALSPMAAAIAVDPWSLGTQGGPWWIAGVVLCWVAGFDIIYSLQDVAVDRDQALHSAPARLGVPLALGVARVLHVLAAVGLVMTGLVDDRLGLLWSIGTGIAIVLLVQEHLQVARRGVAGVPTAFFTLNGIISLVLGGFGALDILIW